jgi:hypothetical protein
MARIARDAGMLPIEWKTGRCAVIKLRGVKPHNLKILSVMIAMTPGARSVGHVSMDPPGGVRGGFDFLVAFEALLVGKGLPVRMARCAFADTFQFVMRADEFAGGELCLRSERNERAEYQEHPEPDHSAPRMQPGKNAATSDIE